MSITSSTVSMKKYGITEQKKAELDLLSIEVLDAEHDVQQYQAIVTSLTEKYEKFLGYESVDEANKQQALNNKNLIDKVVQDTLDLKNNSNIAFGEIVLADEKIKDVAIDIKQVINELIYTVEIINNLSKTIIQKKAKNPLISDELIDMLATTEKDANNAVSLTLLALESTYAAQATNQESEAASALEYRQAIGLYELISGYKHIFTKDKSKKNRDKGSLQELLHTAYDNAKSEYHIARKATKETREQLNKANMKLNKAEIKLNSLQLGYAAANAAALAS